MWLKGRRGATGENWRRTTQPQHQTKWLELKQHNSSAAAAVFEADTDFNRPLCNVSDQARPPSINNDGATHRPPSWEVWCFPIKPPSRHGTTCAVCCSINGKGERRGVQLRPRPAFVACHTCHVEWVKVSGWIPLGVSLCGCAWLNLT